jgi:hypothetical protein
MRTFAVAVLAFLLAACSGTTAAPPASPTPSAAEGGLSGGLVAFIGSRGVGVLDPATGKSTIVAPVAPGAFRVMGPVWGPAPGLTHPVIYFTVHDDRPAESRNSPGVVPYDWLFRVDPFTGVIDPVAASWDPQSEGPFGLFANEHWLGLTVGCCATYEVDALDLTKPIAALKPLSRPPDQAALFTEGIAPGASDLIAVRGFATGAWYWLNAGAAVLHPFPLKLGPDDGPIAVSADGGTVAVALPSGGAVIEPFNSALPIASPPPVTTAGATPSAAASPSPKPSAGPPTARRVNSKLLHPDDLVFSDDAKRLLMAVNGELELYDVGAPDGPPAKKFLTGQGVIGVDWSPAIPGETYDAVKPSAGPQKSVDALLAATRLPSAADTSANRPLTQVYVWQFDSSKPSPIATISDASEQTLAKYPPLAAGVTLHHWAATNPWTLLGGCYRYRVVITGSVAPVAMTIGLTGNALCSAKASPTA